MTDLVTLAPTPTTSPDAPSPHDSLQAFASFGSLAWAACVPRSHTPASGAPIHSDGIAVYPGWSVLFPTLS